MKKILIIRLDGLGDTLLTLPLLDGLHTCWPDCRITYLASPRGAAVFAADTRIADLWTQELSTLSKQEKDSLSKRIHAATFDIVFCLNEKFWPAIWAWKSAAPLRLGFDPGWTQFPKAILRRLTLTHHLYNPNDPTRQSIHEVKRYAALAALAGCPGANGPMRLALPDEAKEWGAAQLAGLNLPPSCIPISLHLSAKWCGEGWNPQLCVEVAQAILERFTNVFLIVTAGPGEDRFFENATDSLPSNRFRLFTDLSLMHWAALLSQSRGLVSMDTGAVHLAAAVNVPVVAVFPETNFIHASSRWSPWRVPHQIVRRPGPTQSDLFLTAICSALEDLL